MRSRMILGAAALAATMVCGAAAFAQQTVPGPNTAQSMPRTPGQSVPVPGSAADSVNPSPMPPGSIAGQAPGMQPGPSGRTGATMTAPATPAPMPMQPPRTNPGMAAPNAPVR